MKKTPEPVQKLTNLEQVQEQLQTPKVKQEKTPDIIATSYITTVHGKGTDAIAGISTKKKKKKESLVNLTLWNNNVDFIFEETEKLSIKLGISAHKLLTVGTSYFTQNNDIRGAKGNLDYFVSIPLKEFAIKCGYNVIPEQKDTTAAQEKENNRAKNLLKKFTKQVKNDLELLSTVKLNFREKLRHNETPFNLKIIGTNTIKSGYINWVFDVAYGNYLAQLPLTKINEKSLKIDPRNKTAYIINQEFNNHYFMYGNHSHGTEQILTVKKLLEKTSLPTIKTVRETKKSWWERIKEPFETALDYLTIKNDENGNPDGFIKDWKYVNKNGVELTNNEATFTSYEQWESARVFYTLENQEELKQNIQKGITANKEKKRARRQQKKGV